MIDRSWRRVRPPRRPAGKAPPAVELLARYWWTVALRGSLTLLFGLTVLIRPAGTAVMTGALEIVSAVRLWCELTGGWLLAAGGVFSVVAGFLLVLLPVTGVAAVARLVGIYALGYGLALALLALRLRQLKYGES